MSGIEGLLAGRVLADRYLIEAVIGRGGMGAVYRATDERLGRAVAVKVITMSGGADAEARERLRARFLREARAAAALPHHPNVVPVYDYGTDPTLELDFIVMELLRGEDLASRLARSGPPPLTTALWILTGAARGVAVGHRAGLIHRDVKPGNVFLAEGDHADEVQVRVLDFGIAKLAAEEDTLSQLTQDGRVPLSPAFASPEQLRGLRTLTPASDVFSLGAIGFQLLTGERPFTDADRNRMSVGMPVPPPSIRELNPAVPPVVEEVVLRALAPEPAERWPDAAVMASACEQARREMGDAPLPPYPATPKLATAHPTGRPAAEEDRTLAERPDERTEFLGDETLLAPGAPPPVVAEPPSTRRQRRQERQGRGGGWIAGLLVALVLLAAAATFGWWLMDERQPARQAVVVPVEDSVVAVDSIEEPPPPTLTDALIRNLEGRRFYNAGDYATALEYFRDAVEIAPTNAEYRNNYALTLFRLGRVEEAADELEGTIQLDPNRAAAYANLADVRIELGDTAEAVAALENAVRLSDSRRDRAVAEGRLRELERAQGPPAVPFPDVVEVPGVQPPGPPSSPDTAATIGRTPATR